MYICVSVEAPNFRVMRTPSPRPALDRHIATENSRRHITPENSRRHINPENCRYRRLTQPFRRPLHYLQRCSPATPLFTECLQNPSNPADSPQRTTTTPPPPPTPNHHYPLPHGHYHTPAIRYTRSTAALPRCP